MGERAAVELHLDQGVVFIYADGRTEGLEKVSSKRVVVNRIPQLLRLETITLKREQT